MMKGHAMKQMIMTGLLGLLAAGQAFAQEGTGIGYIPGMPVPQPAANAAAAAPAPAPGAGKSDGKIVRVSKSGQQRQVPEVQPAPAPETAPAPVSPEYHGVTPPKRMQPENAGDFAKTAGNQLTWIGFMPEKNVHSVFVQTTSPTKFERLASPGNRVELLVTGTKLAVNNNERELDMKYFKSPFVKAYARPQGKNIHVTVELKEAVPVEVTQTDNLISIKAKPAS